MLSDAQIQELGTLLEQTTAGKWLVGKPSDAVISSDRSLRMPGPYGPKAQADYGGYLVGESMRPLDRDFVILAHNWMAELLAEVKAVRATVRALTETT